MGKFLVLFLSMLLSGLAHSDAALAEGRSAAYMRSIDLLSMCRMEGADLDINLPSFCETYIAGVIDTQNMLKGMDFTTPVTFCIPEQYSIKQVSEIVLNDLAASPQHDHFIAAPAVTLALFKAFPCKKKK